MDTYEDLYVIADGSRDNKATTYREAVRGPGETLDEPTLEALTNGTSPLDLILRDTKFRAIPIWRLVEKLEEHDLFRELFDEFILEKETKES